MTMTCFKQGGNHRWVRVPYLVLFILVTFLWGACSPPMAISSIELYESVEKYTLDNGMSVLLKPIDHARSVSLQIWVQAGSLYETEQNNGLSHVLEHMAFKGSETYTGEQLTELIEGVGGRQNAATSKDYTFYYVTVPSAHWERGLRVLEQIVLHPTFPENEFEKERRVVLSELARYQDNPERLLWKRFIPRLYDDHPYQRLTIGSRKVLKQVTLDQLKEYYRTYYQPSRMTLVVAGQFDSDRVRSSVRQLLADEPSSPFEPPSFPPVEPPRSSRVKREDRSVRQCYGLIGTTGVSVGSDHSEALDVLMTIFGGGQSSRLYRNLVREQRLATSISASYWTQRETGPVLVRFQTEPGDLEPLLKGIHDQARRMIEQGISEEELKRAKTQIRTDFLYSAQTPQGQARQMGYWETISELDYLQNYLERINAVDRGELKSIGRTILLDQNWVGHVFEPNDS